MDSLATGRMARILSVVDAFTRERLALEADTKLGIGRVTRVLDRPIDETGRPEGVRSDNRPEFTSRPILGWANERKVDQVHIQPGRPMQNDHVESFRGRQRDECLTTAWFRTLGDVRQKLAAGVQLRAATQFADYRTLEDLKRASAESWAIPQLSAQTTIINSKEKLQLRVVERTGEPQCN